MELWEVPGVIILAGPLVITLISLVFTFIKTGYEDFIESRRERWVLKDTVEEVKEYIEQLKAFKKGSRSLYFLQYLMSIRSKC